MKKKYLNPQADPILLKKADILTASAGDEHGMNVPVESDSDWQIGEIGEIEGA